MAYLVQKLCKICGREYTPCADCENDKSAFHWRIVACSAECGKKYLEKVEKARKKQIKKEHTKLNINVAKDEKNIPKTELAIENDNKKIEPNIFDTNTDNDISNKENNDLL